MADLLILNGSPRAKGNSAFLTARAAEIARKSGATVEAVALAKKKIAPCTACESCVQKKVKYCSITDDMVGIYESLIAAKALLIVSPVYWFTYSAQLKTAIDRLYGLWYQEPDFLKGKRVGAALVYGDEDIYSSGGINAIGTFEHMFRFLRADLAGFAYGSAGDPGDVEKNEKFLGDLERLVAKILRGAIG